MKHQLYRDKTYTFFLKFMLGLIISPILFSYHIVFLENIGSFLKFSQTIFNSFNILVFLMIILTTSISSILSIILFIYLLNKYLDRIHLFVRSFKPYTKEEVNAIYLDESIDIDFIYYKLIPYSKYNNDKTIDQHITIDRLLKQRRPLDMKLSDISFSENDMAILL